MFLTGKVAKDHCTQILGGVDLYNKDYYADWSQGAFGGAFNIYKPVYGTVSAAGMPVNGTEVKDIRERGVRVTAVAAAHSRTG